ncbi:MAG: NAD(P)H-binding protein [Nitrosopumilaceae archaeon]|nr:NAD(P)H-binding protein [Nitrosopumilaceae archaeon]NIU00259.1 NAD(P)H-binding protein [Nitrosopumilaceae archaeon]NIU86671.1 NAD(P)H-binding protein [Nitrosopumilaceae archaeon]NIV65366.1 NAD(P)H-binding protein [Nitrosopumilaceae archaeon]NIX60861.1 NAD(P)H-binding protein [Nitrosopumilaceae archaeon]
MSDHLHVAITGASGFVGKNLRRFLSKKGIKVTAISRKDFRVFDNETKVRIKDYKENKIIQNLKNCNVLIHLVGIGRQTIHNDYEETNVGITERLVKKSKEVGIKKIIYNSGLGVHQKTTVGYFISKLKAERIIIGSGIGYTIFRPSYIVGRDDPLTKNLKKQIKKGVIKIPGSAKYRMQPITINDVSEIIYQAISGGSYTNKTLDLVGPKVVTFGEYTKKFNQNRAKIKKIDLEQAYRSSMNDPNSLYGFDDLNIMIGDFIGNHSIIKNISKIEFELFEGFLKSSSLS